MPRARPRIAFRVKLHHRNLPDSVLLDDLRRVARKLKSGKPLNNHLYAQFGGFGVKTITDRFGTWNTALRTAGLPVGLPRSMPDHLLFENLVRVWRRLGRQPTGRDLAKHDGLSQLSQSRYRTRFGSWNAALIAFQNYVDAGHRKRPAPEKPRAKRRPRHKLSWRKRAQVLLRDHSRCRMCGATPAGNAAVKLHVDHIVPVSKGGDSTLANLQTLCEQCNLGKSNIVVARARWRRPSS